MDALPTNRTWPPSFSHGTYQHKAITSRSRQLLMMGTWLPETCWATIRREIKEYKKWHLVGFSYPHKFCVEGITQLRRSSRLAIMFLQVHGTHIQRKCDFMSSLGTVRINVTTWRIMRMDQSQRCKCQIIPLHFTLRYTSPWIQS